MNFPHVTTAYTFDIYRPGITIVLPLTGIIAKIVFVKLFILRYTDPVMVTSSAPSRVLAVVKIVKNHINHHVIHKAARFNTFWKGEINHLYTKSLYTKFLLSSKNGGDACVAAEMFRIRSIIFDGLHKPRRSGAEITVNRHCQSAPVVRHRCSRCTHSSIRRRHRAWSGRLRGVHCRWPSLHQKADGSRPQSSVR